MSHAPEAVHHLPAVPERLRFPLPARAVAAVLALAGAGAFGWALASGQPELAWSSYLIGAFYALGLGVFGTLWVAILYLSKGVWSVTMRRIPEAMAVWLVPGVVLAALVGLGAHSLYHWSHAEAVAADALLAHKSPFLNLTTFWALTAVCFALWLAFTAAILRNSARQDETGEARLTHRNTALSALFAVVFALTFSVVSWYLLMSLDAHWFSTMFAVLTFTDAMQAGTAVVSLVAAVVILRGGLNGFLNENHLHSIAKMMFATTGFWAYIAFCQFLLIWYSNIPEETVYYIARWENGWLPYLLALPALKFVVPFVLLVPRAAKRSPRRVAAMAILILFAQFWELFLMVSPSVGHGGERSHGHIPAIELVVTLGFLGAFFLVFAWALARRNPVPLKDPFIRAAIHHHE